MRGMRTGVFVLSTACVRKACAKRPLSLDLSLLLIFLAFIFLFLNHLGFECFLRSKYVLAVYYCTAVVGIYFRRLLDATGTDRRSNFTCAWLEEDCMHGTHTRDGGTRRLCGGRRLWVMYSGQPCVACYESNMGGGRKREDMGGRERA
ncbi:unnamed protein product [Ectocarpus fasciculatus]